MQLAAVAAIEVSHLFTFNRFMNNIHIYTITSYVSHVGPLVMGHPTLTIYHMVWAQPGWLV